MPPVIRLSHHAEVQLTAWWLATQGKEFSGLGLIEREGNSIFHVVDVFLLGVGSEVYTEFNPERQRALNSDPRLKLWFHRHPIGSGNPGDPGNWSGRDNQTAEREPFGVDPKLVQWSVSIVRTPGGWVGRVDVYLPTLKTFHCAVEPRVPSEEIIAEAKTYINDDLREYLDTLYNEYLALSRRASRPERWVQRSYDTDDYNDDLYANWVLDPRDYEPSGYFCSQDGCEGVELIDAGEEESFEINLTVSSFQCPCCGQVYYTQWSPDAIEIRVDSNEPPVRQSRKRKVRDWARSWSKVFGISR